MQEFHVHILGFDCLKDLYEDDVDFRQAFEACKKLVSIDKIPWRDFMLQDGLLFKKIQLCIPRFSMRETLMQEKHNGGLIGHFGVGKIVENM